MTGIPKTFSATSDNFLISDSFTWDCAWYHKTNQEHFFLITGL